MTPDFAVFCQTVLKDIEKGGRRLVLAPIHLAWILHIWYCWVRDLDALILAPMGHGKSTIVSVGLPLFLIGHNPNNRIRILSANGALAEDRVSLIKLYMDEDEDYKQCFPHVRPKKSDKWSRDKLYVERSGRSPDATLEGRGIGSGGAGTRCDYLILDDPVDSNNAATAHMRKVIRDRYNLMWRTRLESWGKVVMIGTPYHDEDLNWTMRNKPRTCTLTMRIGEKYNELDWTVEGAPDRDHPLATWATSISIEAA